MEIIIHGSNDGGAKEFYSKPNFPFVVKSAILKDPRRGSNEESLGQSVYSIEFVPQGCAFTKLVIGRDVKRTAVGYIAFTIFIQNSTKLSGADTKELLDRLATEYFEINHITAPDFVIGNDYDDTSFVESLTNQFRNRLAPALSEDSQTFEHGSDEAAYVYYSSNEEIINFFDAPYQKQYNSLKQVFFVQSELQDKPENPLNALRHDLTKNLTGKIDLENPPYKLKDFLGIGKNDVIIEIWANGKKRKNSDVIYKKDNIQIRFSKNKYYSPIVLEGKLTDEKFNEYINIVDNNKIVIKSEVKLNKEVKTVNVIVNENREGKIVTIYDADITYKNLLNEEKKVANNKIYFEGEEQKNKWSISAKRGDFKGIIEIVPENQNDTLVLYLEEHKLVKFEIKDESNNKIDFYISVRNSNPSIKIVHNKELEVIGEAIENDVEIQISSPEFESKNLTINPRSQNNFISATLKKKSIQKKKKYIIKVGENGTKISSAEYTNNKDGYDVDLKPNKGYSFVKWDIRDTNDKNFDGELVAVFKKKKSLPIWGWFFISFIGLLFVGITIFFVFKYFDTSSENKINDSESNSDNNSQPTQDLTTHINEYLREGKLESDSLRHFDTLSIKDSSTIKKIKSAINLRYAINSGNIDSLKKIDYAYADGVQSDFKNTIDKISPNYVKQISDSLKHHMKGAEMYLNDVSDYINKFQDNLNKNGPQNKALQTNKQPALIPYNPNRPVAKTTNPDVTGILNYLDANFWDLVNNKNTNLSDYKKLVKKYNDKNIHDDISSYLNRICISKESFKELTNIDEAARINAHELKDLK